MRMTELLRSDFAESERPPVVESSEVTMQMPASIAIFDLEI
jgi:hypothetical protein